MLSDDNSFYKYFFVFRINFTNDIKPYIYPNLTTQTLSKQDL